eukprot:IDg20821t1
MVDNDEILVKRPKNFVTQCLCGEQDHLYYTIVRFLGRGMRFDHLFEEIMSEAYTTLKKLSTRTNSTLGILKMLRIMKTGHENDM